MCWCPQSTAGSPRSNTTSALVTSTISSACSRTPAPSCSSSCCTSALRSNANAAGTPGRPGQALEVLDERHRGTQAVERVPEGVRNAAGGHAHALGAMDHRASQLKTHRNLMIATLVREVLKGCSCATRGDSALEHFTVGDRGKTPPDRTATPRWVMAAAAYTSLWPQCSQKRSPVCTVPWHWGQSQCSGQVPQGLLVRKGGGYRRRGRDRRSRRGFGGLLCRRAGSRGLLRGRGGCSRRSGGLDMGLFPSGRPSCCSCPAAFHRPPGECCPDRPFRKLAPGEHAHHQRQQRRKPKPAQTPG